MFDHKHTWIKEFNLISTSTNKLNLTQIENFNNTIRNLSVPFYMEFIGNNKEKIIYKRLTPVGDWNFFRLLHYDWYGCETTGTCKLYPTGEDNKPPRIENKEISNTMNVDFKLFNNLNDAKNDTNAWTYCNFNDDGVGFPRDCGVSGNTISSGPLPGRWISYYPGETVGNMPFFWRVILEGSDNNYECPSEFPYPVQTGPFVSGGLCYNQAGFADVGQGAVNSWCARTPQYNSEIERQITDSQGSPC